MNITTMLTYCFSGIWSDFKILMIYAFSDLFPNLAVLATILIIYCVYSTLLMRQTIASGMNKLAWLAWIPMFSTYLMVPLEKWKAWFVHILMLISLMPVVILVLLMIEQKQYEGMAICGTRFLGSAMIVTASVLLVGIMWLFVQIRVLIKMSVRQKFSLNKFFLILFAINIVVYLLDRVMRDVGLIAT